MTHAFFCEIGKHWMTKSESLKPSNCWSRDATVTSTWPSHQEVVQQVSRGFSTSKTSENLVKPWKPQDLETYVSFSGNLLEIFYVEISGNL